MRLRLPYRVEESTTSPVLCYSFRGIGQLPTRSRIWTQFVRTPWPSHSSFPRRGTGGAAACGTPKILLLDHPVQLDTKSHHHFQRHARRRVPHAQHQIHQRCPAREARLSDITLIQKRGGSRVRGRLRWPSAKGMPDAAESCNAGVTW